MIEFTCPACESTLRVADELASRSILCRDCNTRVRVPKLALKEDKDGWPRYSKTRPRAADVICIVAWLGVLLAVVIIYGDFDYGMRQAETAIQQVVAGIRACVSLLSVYILARAVGFAFRYASPRPGRKTCREDTEEA